MYVLAVPLCELQKSLYRCDVGKGLVAVGLLLNAVLVVLVSFHNRELAHEWQALGETHDQLQENYGRLMLEYSTLAAPSRVEFIARQTLGMDFPDKSNTQVIELNE